MFPRIAVERRLVWGKLDGLNFDLITTYHNMHATKPHPQYYREILSKLDCPPAEALMVGDDWELDLAPAASLGMHTFWIVPGDVQLPHENRGDLTALRVWLETNHA